MHVSRVIIQYFLQWFTQAPCHRCNCDTDVCTRNISSCRQWSLSSWQTHKATHYNKKAADHQSRLDVNMLFHTLSLRLYLLCHLWMITVSTWVCIHQQRHLTARAKAASYWRLSRHTCTYFIQWRTREMWGKFRKCRSYPESDEGREAGGSSPALAAEAWLFSALCTCSETDRTAVASDEAGKVRRK